MVQVVFFGIEIRFDKVYGRLSVLQKIAVRAEQLISAAKFGSRGNIATRRVIGVAFDNAAVDRRRKHDQAVEIAVLERLQLGSADGRYDDQSDLGDVNTVGFGDENKKHMRKRSPRA